MKKRYLRPSIEKLLTVITMLMGMLTCMVNDFEISLRTFGFALIWFGIIALNCYILKKFGRGLLFEKED